ncbi:hypothetical protein EMPS_02999 [Entomortierella parvispora]|uniref:Uncharacterized protein n=1 Tax=Entomortierella parvispora TaxID=205924 RepID=A0A9P3H5R4_9FUNG|nr:hypothetical protein EMPS_02999 [Entomortierella parvispora]
MASINSRFDTTPAATGDSSDGPWLTTYSRGLCSLYPKDEDCCWDALLSSQIQEERPNSPFANEITEPRIYHANSSTMLSRAHGSKAMPMSSEEKVNEAAISSGATVYSKYESEQQAASPTAIGRSSRNGNQDSVQLSTVMTSPQGGRLPHALCSLGFDCIDFITATGGPEEVAASSSTETAMNSSPSAYPRSLAQRSSATDVGCVSSFHGHPQLEAESRIQEDLEKADIAESWAAAVCGKRTAALERKRLLSRTFSQGSIEPANHDPWFETLDRLSRWDEVAYR